MGTKGRVSGCVRQADYHRDDVLGRTGVVGNGDRVWVRLVTRTVIRKRSRMRDRCRRRCRQKEDQCDREAAACYPKEESP